MKAAAPPVTLRLLASSWRSWVSSDLEPVGPAWLQWAWTLAFAAVIALVFTLIGFAISTGSRPGIWLDPAIWARWYRVNFVVSLSVAVTIHLLFMAVIAAVGKRRIRAFSYGQRALFTTAIPIVGVLAGWPLGVWLVSQQGIGWVRLSSATLASSVAVGGLISFVIYLVFSARARQAEAEKRAAEAQLRLLQGQMEPHFLFNTLAGVLTLIDADPARARQMLESFTDYLRATLASLRQGDSTVAAELALAEAYLQLMQLRMEDRLRFTIEADAGARAAAVPPLLLQPLVENAICHGLEPQLDGGTLAVEARVDGDALVLAVRDDGPGPDAGRRHSAGNGVALDNIRQRLQALHGGDATLTIAPLHPGTCATLRLPLIRSTA